MVDNQHFLGIGVTAFVHLAGPGVPASPNTLVNLEMPTVTSNYCIKILFFIFNLFENFRISF